MAEIIPQAALLKYPIKNHHTFSFAVFTFTKQKKIEPESSWLDTATGSI